MKRPIVRDIILEGPTKKTGRLYSFLLRHDFETKQL